MDDFLAPVRVEVDSNAPHLRPLFDMMAGEARFARWWLDDDLKNAARSSPDPRGRWRRVPVACYWRGRGTPSQRSSRRASVSVRSRNWANRTRTGRARRRRAQRRALQGRELQVGLTGSGSRTRSMSWSTSTIRRRPSQRVTASLSPGGSYRFLCPNYLFPYEPHFNMPTFGSKGLTETTATSRIQGNTKTSDPRASGSRSTGSRSRRSGEWQGEESLDVRLRQGTLASMIERAVDDVEFAKRRAPWMVTAVKALKSAGLLRFASLIPTTFQPLMDVRLTRPH